jgi:hypothetical protein
LNGYEHHLFLAFYHFCRLMSASRRPAPGHTSTDEATPVPLPVAAMDVEVFERYIMRTLTSLHRIAAKIAIDLHPNGAGVGGGGGVSTVAVLGEDDVTLRSLWTLVRRTTRRIERLRVMQYVLQLKYASLESQLKQAELLMEAAEASPSATFSPSACSPGGGAATEAPRHSAATTTSNRSTAVMTLRGDVFMVEALATKVRSSIEEFQLMETDWMQRLCH